MGSECVLACVLAFLLFCLPDFWFPAKKTPDQNITNLPFAEEISMSNISLFQNYQSRSSPKKFPLTFVEKSPKNEVQQCKKWASSSSGKLNLSMPICHKLLRFCYRNAWKITNIRENFTPFVVAPFLKGLCACYFSFLYFFEQWGGKYFLAVFS